MIIQKNAEDKKLDIKDGDLLVTETSTFLIVRTLKKDTAIGGNFIAGKFVYVNLSTNRLAYNEYDTAIEIYNKIKSNHSNVELVKSKDATLNIGVANNG